MCYKISLVQLISNLNVILYLSTCYTVYISVLILFKIMCNHLGGGGRNTSAHSGGDVGSYHMLRFETSVTIFLSHHGTHTTRELSCR